MFKLLPIVFVTIFLASCSSNSNFVDVAKPSYANNKILADFTKQIVFKDWYLLSNNNKQCALVSYPSSSYGDYVNRQIHYFYITYNKTKRKYEIAIIGGADYQANDFASVKIEDYVFMFPTINNQAWSNNESLIITLLTESKNLWFFVESNFNNAKVTDKYSLKGFGNAIKSFNKFCM